jgi:hypothetical protein
MNYREHDGRTNLVSVPTELLRDRLNRLYGAVRRNARNYSAWGRFDYLWDLKELAVLEGRGSVEIPDSWLDELERIYVEFGEFSGRGS